MPTYDYKCEKCGSQVETYHSVNEHGPSCCGQPMQKVYTTPGIIFKGDGWAGKS